jgi:hypothetical protein
MILQQLMLLVPDENRLVLQTLLLFLNDIAKNHKTNQVFNHFNDYISIFFYNNVLLLKDESHKPSSVLRPGHILAQLRLA